MRLASRSPQAPRSEVVLAEVLHTVDLVLYTAIVKRGGDHRERRLMSVGWVGGLDDGRPLVQELVGLGQDGAWHRAGSPAAMPERVWTKLARVCDPATLLDGFDG
ncbi:MAG: hypothetical protein ACHQC8_06770 [Solirubrobacterales bacterium]